MTRPGKVCHLEADVPMKILVSQEDHRLISLSQCLLYLYVSPKNIEQKFAKKTNPEILKRQFLKTKKIGSTSLIFIVEWKR